MRYIKKKKNIIIIIIITGQNFIWSLLKLFIIPLCQ